MEQIFSLVVMALLLSIIIGSWITIEIIESLAKITLTRNWKKLVTVVIGLTFSIVWYYVMGNIGIDVLILTFLSSVGFYDIIIKTLLEKVNNWK